MTCRDIIPRNNQLRKRAFSDIFSRAEWRGALPMTRIRNVSTSNIPGTLSKHITSLPNININRVHFCNKNISRARIAKRRKVPFHLSCIYNYNYNYDYNYIYTPTFPLSSIFNSPRLPIPDCRTVASSVTTQQKRTTFSPPCHWHSTMFQDSSNCMHVVGLFLSLCN